MTSLAVVVLQCMSVSHHLIVHLKFTHCYMSEYLSKAGGKGAAGSREDSALGQWLGEHLVTSLCRPGEDVRFDSIALGGRFQQEPVQADLHA